MASEDNSLSTAALVVALVALITAFGQLLQQYFSTADGYRRCQSSVIGPWAKRTRLRFRWSQFRFETMFTVPRIMIQRIVWDSSETPTSPHDDGCWVIGDMSKADDSNTLVSGNAEETPELVTWLRFLRSIQWTHKRMLFSLSKVPALSSKSKEAAWSFNESENKKLTIPFIKFEERSWDFMPPDVVKPYALINLGDLGILARRLGMDWERFEPSDGILRAQGNGYNLVSVVVRSVGILVEFSEILGSGTGASSIPWLTPVIPERAKEKTLLIPCAPADKMMFGILPGMGSDFHQRDFNVSTLDEIAHVLQYFTQDDILIAAFKSGDWKQSNWCPGVADLLTFIAPMMYRPEVNVSGVPRPDDYRVFHGVTDEGAASDEFRILLGFLLQGSRHRADDDLLWLEAKLERICSYGDFWARESNWLELYYQDDSMPKADAEAKAAIYEAFLSATERLNRIIESAQLPTRRTWYYHLVQFHLMHMFDYGPHDKKYQGTRPASWERYLQTPYPTDSAKSQSDIWRQRMDAYFLRLPLLARDLWITTGLEKTGLPEHQVETAWLLMLFRGLCWSRCHRLTPGKTIPLQYCGSQLPVFLG